MDWIDKKKYIAFSHPSSTFWLKKKHCTLVDILAGDSIKLPNFWTAFEEQIGKHGPVSNCFQTVWVERCQKNTRHDGPKLARMLLTKMSVDIFTTRPIPTPEERWGKNNQQSWCWKKSDSKPKHRMGGLTQIDCVVNSRENDNWCIRDILTRFCFFPFFWKPLQEKLNRPLKCIIYPFKGVQLSLLPMVFAAFVWRIGGFWMDSSLDTYGGDLTGRNGPWGKSWRKKYYSTNSENSGKILDRKYSGRKKNLVNPFENLSEFT